MNEDDWKPLGQREIRRQRLKSFTRKIDLRGCHTAICSCSGVFATSEIEPDTITLATRPKVRIFNPNGTLLSEDLWKSGRIVFMFFAVDLELLNIVTEDGKLLQFDLGMKLLTSFSVSSEQILEAETFRTASTLGLVILTMSGNFPVLPDYENSLKRLDIGPIMQDVSDCWTVISSKHRNLYSFRDESEFLHCSRWWNKSSRSSTDKRLEIIQQTDAADFRDPADSLQQDSRSHNRAQHCSKDQISSDKRCSSHSTK